MILRRYGSNVQSVRPNFDARAMTEIGFMRTPDIQMAADEFETAYDRLDVRELSATANGDVQGEVEEAVLAQLSDQLSALEHEQADKRVLVVENRPGLDPPKTRCTQTTRVVEGTNKLHFEYTIEPPLKVGVYEPKRG